MAGDRGASLLSFMDLLDVEEEAVDERLQGIMSRSSFPPELLQRAALLLQYKLLLNSYDHADSDNQAEVEFAIKLLTIEVDRNAECICNIVNLALRLNMSNVEFKAQHILQQMLSDFDFSSVAKVNELCKDTLLFKLKVFDSILDAVLSSRVKILFLNDTPIENILYSDDVEVRNHFLMNTVVKLVEVVEGMSILDKIWISVSMCGVNYENKALIAISSLSDYYLPVPNENGIVKFKSAIICKRDFWTMVLKGLKSQDSFNRKASLYLTKRAIDCVTKSHRDITILMPDNVDTVLVWKSKEAKSLEESWKCFFILLETLEEKQGNLVQAALSLFQQISNIGNQWCNCAFELALKHPNLAVVQTCLEYKLVSGVTSFEEAKMILEALNNIHMFDCSKSSEHLMVLFCKSCSDPSQLKYILRAFNDIKWLPISLFRLTEIFSDLKLNIGLFEHLNESEMTSIVCSILHQPCNNLIIAEGVHCNVVNFIFKNGQGFGVQNFMEIVSNAQCDFSRSLKISLDVSLLMKSMCENEHCEGNIWKFLSQCCSIDILLMYLRCHPDEIQLYLPTLQKRFDKLRDVNSRPYACKDEYYSDFSYICKLIKKLRSYSDSSQTEVVCSFIKNNIECLLMYIMDQMIIPEALNIDEFNVYMEHCPYVFSLCPLEMIRNELNKFRPNHIEHLPYVTVIGTTDLLNDSNKDLFFKKYICSRVTNALEDLKERGDTGFLHYHGEIKLGKLRNQVNETSCELAYSIITANNSIISVDHLMSFLHEMLDTGGIGCLVWVLKIHRAILPQLCEEENSAEFDFSRFLERAWKEVADLRSNAHYRPTMKEFVSILLHNCLLARDKYQKLVLHYCTKILDYGSVSNVPLNFIMDEVLKKGKSCDYLLLNMILSEVLMFGRGSCKDRRITDSTVRHIIDNKEKFFSIDLSKRDYYFDSEIRNKAIKVLIQNTSPRFINGLAAEILNKVLAVFHNKTRYHANSQPHRILLRALQHTLFMSVICPEGVDLDETVSSYTHLLEKLPHQPSVRIYMEILVSFYVIVQKLSFNEGTLGALKLKTIPLPSLFTIMYLVIKEKLKGDKKSIVEEFKFVLDYILSHAMGQIFSIRLSAQYFACQLYKLGASSLQEISTKYEQVFKIIQKTFDDSKTEKNLLKLQNCFFANRFDVIENLTPKFIYYFVPKYTNVECDEIMECDQIPTVDDCIKYIKASSKTNIELCAVWLEANKREPIEELVADVPEVKEEISVLDVSTVQKKYIPWSNMFHGEEASMMNAQKRAKDSGLIVVASLINKLPNLGGLARTSEVFGVKKYVISNLQHVEDKQFQGLSVSAERWVQMEQVKPGQQLKEYLQRMKREGYTVVAAEQTSSSVSLQDFRFPYKTVLLLGHEKEGVPCDLLPLADRCVEVPQRGLVRSLNVHVTAAIFVWEYVRQNLL